MATKTATCAVCQGEFPITEMRYNKCKISGEWAWEYQCSSCRRKIKDGEIEH